jgi:hypothetical protein
MAQVTTCRPEDKEEATMCVEMTKAIDRWENEGGRTDDLPLTVCADSRAMPTYPLRSDFLSTESRRVATSDAAGCSNPDMLGSAR